MNRDLSSPVPWRRSLRASQARRVQRARRRRVILRGRAGLTLAVVLSAVAAGGAVAQDAAAPPAPGVQSADTVRALQQKLGISADGVYGPKTRAAVKRFQRAHGLMADGVAGPRTLAALGVTAAAPEPQAEASDTSAAPASDADGTLQRIAQLRVGRQPDRRVRRRHLPRQVPVRPHDVARDGGYRRSRRRPRGRAGPHRRPVAGPARDRAVAGLRHARPAVRATPCAPRPRRRTARGRRRAAPRCG